MIVDGNCQFYGTEDLAHLLERMDAAGIDRTVLSAAIDGACVPGRDHPLQGVGNAAVAAAVASHPDRLIGCFHLNPLQPGLIATVAEYADSGFRAVKLFPAEGYFPDDERLYELFDAIQDRGLAVLVSLGLPGFTLHSEKGARRALNSAWAYPMRLDAPSRLFPRVRFVILGMGFPLLFEAWSVHHANKNIWLDITGSGPSASALPVAYASLGGPAFIPLDFDKMVWGSANAPDPGAALSVADSHLRMMGCTDEKQRSRVFGDNAARLLGLAT
jgi:predicted TIM-barrel fold metal-dependent hydrolase